MLSTAIILEIRRLLDEGELPYRAIADKLCVSRGVVGNVALGRRGLHGGETPLDVPAADEPPGLAARCRGCGGMVYKPCRLCGARAYRQRRELLRQLTLPTPHRTPRRVA